MVAVVGCGLMAGLFFAFSVAVMPALRRLPPAEGASAMQGINRTILNPVFGVAFGGATVACVLLPVLVLVGTAGGGAWRVTGALLYLVGTFLVTVVGNVPMNNRLDAAGPDGDRVWPDYLRRWTAWNHVRTVTSTAATAVLALAL